MSNSERLDYIKFATHNFVTNSLSSHNILSSAHEDIRTFISELSAEIYSLSLSADDIIIDYNNLYNSLSAYSTLSGSIFYGDIFATNLTGTNTGDQDLSSFALSSDLNNLSNSLSSYALQTFVTSSIFSHNTSGDSHQDIRTLITNVNNNLSDYSTQTFTFSALSTHNEASSTHQDIRTDISTLSSEFLSSLELTSNNLIDDINTLENSLSAYVPYMGASLSVNLGNNSLSAYNIYTNSITSSGPLSVGDIKQLTSGNVSYTASDLVSSININNTRNLVITRNVYGFVININDGINTWTYTRDANNKILSWNYT